MSDFHRHIEDDPTTRRRAWRLALVALVIGAAAAQLAALLALLQVRA
jgi:hypothetical protein